MKIDAAVLAELGTQAKIWTLKKVTAGCLSKAQAQQVSNLDKISEIPSQFSSSKYAFWYSYLHLQIFIFTSSNIQLITEYNLSKFDNQIEFFSRT